MEPKIKTVIKGNSDYSEVYSITDESVDEIKQEQRPHLKADNDSGQDIVVFRGYKDGKLVFEIESGSQLSIIYE